ncbi:tricarboxylate carrier protein [Cardiosporidium cionae]|uniref:Tricarboxylate carrier protein n=1 Tax=Cardiosporidium cionae TaxID=476202 RepID=A0ABQ7JBN8_9APIC|nr:tricarboxylate carrier protein [Cardiosporidium cionae]|eukprot:KAF8821381.1 tricarboxylate carrier protein [Cardiosporidium cionae]
MALGAAVVSVGLAVSLTEWLKRGKFSPSTRSKLQAIVPYCAVASAGVSNVVLMRLNELRNVRKAASQSLAGRLSEFCRCCEKMHL